MRPPTDPETKPSDRRAASSPTLGRGVLLVENDPDLQWTLSRAFTVVGCRVVGTSSSDGALATLSTWPADVAVIAEDLPGMSGLELVRQIRAENPALPIVLLANDGPGVDDVAKATGATRVLVKPVRIDEVRALVLGLGAG